MWLQVLHICFAKVLILVTNANSPKAQQEDQYAFPYRRPKTVHTFSKIKTFEISDHRNIFSVSLLNHSVSGD